MNDVPDLARFDLREPESASRVADALRQQGIAMLSGLTDRTALLRAGRSLMTPRIHRDSDSAGVTTIERRFSTAIGSLSGILMLACARRPRSGGQIVLADGYGLYREIAETDPAMLDALRAPRSAYFGSGSGHLGSVFEDQGGHRVAVRLRFDDLVRFSPAASLYVGRLRELVRLRAITLDLAVGEGYVLLNDRWLHGRRRLVGDRTMLRLTGDPLPEHQVASGFLSVGTGISLAVH